MAEIEKIQFHRPTNNDEFKQSKLEKDILVFPLLYACSNAIAYALFHPELCDRRTARVPDVFLASEQHSLHGRYEGASGGIN